MPERQEDERLKGKFVLGHDPVISKVDRYLKVSHQSQGRADRSRKEPDSDF